MRSICERCGSKFNWIRNQIINGESMDGTHKVDWCMPCWRFVLNMGKERGQINVDPKALDVIVIEDWTFRQFWEDCCTELWDEGEGFSGKRPICDSGWQYEIIKGLCEHGFIPADKVVEEPEFPDDFYYQPKDDDYAEKYVSELIKLIFRT